MSAEDRLSPQEEETKKATVEKLVTLRKQNLEYIQRIHKSDNRKLWMDCVLIRQSDFNRYLETVDPAQLQKRCEQWVCLGFSISLFLQLSCSPSGVRALTKLMDEYEMHFGSIATRGLISMRRTLLRTNTPENAEPTFSSASPPPSYTPYVIPVYELLRTPNIPSSLDYRETLFSLCDTLTNLYNKLLLCDQELDRGSRESSVYEMAMKLDSRLKAHVLDPMCDDLHHCADMIVRNQIRFLYPPLASVAVASSSSDPAPTAADIASDYVIT
eukprot:TRINITY_DN7155_c0_g1_i1.p1 TRINITY_DN7155_c0_g1~~TRINITY_DN7155_c0_g1_i1.p1  ORF type:complete len:271 (+),score=59.23 TRINITY_DN7155_c0_g1_i1:43-855(+)